MDDTNTIASAKRARFAVGAIFFMTGFLTGSWAPQIPVFVTRLQISEFTLGLLILLFGLGAVTAMPVSGYLMSQYGSRSMMRWFGGFSTVALLLVALAPNVPLAAIAMFLFGGLIGATDVAMNANAVVVERRLSRAIMSSSHAYWSLGGFAGGSGGGFLIQHSGHLAHAIVVTVISVVIFAAATGYLIADGKSVTQDHRKFEMPKSATVYLVGLIALFCMIPEGAVLDWGALYLHTEKGADFATAGLAFGLFAGTMAVMRFLGDGVRNRFGAVRTFQVSSLIAAVGLLVAGFAPWPWLIIAAFAVAGIGIANTVPIAFSAGGNQPGMASSVGMSVVTTMGYSGILLAPSIIGFTAEKTGLAMVFVALSSLLVIACLMGGLVRTADFDSSRQE